MSARTRIAVVVVSLVIVFAATGCRNDGATPQDSLFEEPGQFFLAVQQTHGPGFSAKYVTYFEGFGVTLETCLQVWDHSASQSVLFCEEQTGLFLTQTFYQAAPTGFADPEVDDVINSWFTVRWTDAGGVDQERTCKYHFGGDNAPECGSAI